MSRFRDAVQRVKKVCKNSLQFNNVYDCARPLLVLMGLFGAGGTYICQEEGVYTLRNSKFSLIVFTIVSLVWSPFVLLVQIVKLFTASDPPRSLFGNIARIMFFLILLLTLSTVGIGGMMTRVYCKRLNTMFQIISNIDSQLERANIRVNHWKITLKVMVLTLITANYYELLVYVKAFGPSVLIVMSVMMHLWYMWTILFLLIIHERFVGLNKLLQENATITNIQVVGERNPRDSYMLRRMTLARHVHEQLTEVLQLFSDTCRYVILGLVTIPIIDTLFRLLALLVARKAELLHVYSAFIQVIRIAVIIGICQVNKSERRVLTARLRHLVAFETDRAIIQQVQQYIMYNAYSTPGLIDFQFTDVDNVLLLTMINIIVSNALIIYSYTRQW